MFIFKYFLHSQCKCMSAFFTHFLMCTPSNCLLHRVSNLATCKVYVYGVLDL